MKHTIETESVWSWARTAASLGRPTASFEELNEQIAQDLFAKIFPANGVTNTKTQHSDFFYELRRFSSCGVADGLWTTREMHLSNEQDALGVLENIGENCAIL